MAVLVEAFEVVARVDAVPGGAANFKKAVPNATFCSDGRLVRAGFMNASDRAQFVARLGIAETTGVALVDPSTADDACPSWLAVGAYAGVTAAWLRAEDPEPLVVPFHWSPSEVRLHTPPTRRAPGERDAMELIGREGGVDVYVDRRTGRRLYAGRTEPALDEASAARFSALRAEASEAVGSAIGSEPRELGFFEKRRLKSGVAKLREALTILPEDWSTHWTLGMTLRAMRAHEDALEHFRRAHAANAFHPDVGREYAGQCMIVGRGAEAVEVSRALHLRFPEDAGLQSNLALALLIAGELVEAETVAAAAHQREPRDPITKALLSMIQRVRAGHAARPTKMPGW